MVQAEQRKRRRRMDSTEDGDFPVQFLPMMLAQDHPSASLLHDEVLLEMRDYRPQKRFFSSFPPVFTLSKRNKRKQGRQGRTTYTTSNFTATPAFVYPIPGAGAD